MADTENHLTRVGDYLPNFVIGAVWLLNISAVAFLSVTPAELERFSASVALGVEALRVSDVAIGFVLAVVGVAAPWAIAVTLNPLSVSVANMILDLFHMPCADRR